MRVRTLRLKNFKRFDDLTIDLGETPRKIVALVGPNGCGKSSVFDAFEQKLQDYVGVNQVQEAWFYSKSWYSAESPVQTYKKHDSIHIEPVDSGHEFGAKSFYVRSAYRFTPRLRVNSIQEQEDPLKEVNRPGSSIGLDQRLQGNYERMLGRLLGAFWEKGTTGAAVRAELVGNINKHLSDILDIQISELGNVPEGKGQLFFSKGASRDFPFENLSAGEKEVVDMIVDLVVKTPIFEDTVYCIDEPELHLNTAVQRRLISSLSDLIPAGCQLWVATHSIGFLRALQQELRDDAQVLDFSEANYFEGSKTIRPIRSNRTHWKRIFGTALDDLTGLMAPAAIIYCEGRADPDDVGDEAGLDAIVYNRVFEERHADLLFVSSGGGGATTKHSELALKVLSKAFDGVDLRLLRDRDDRNEAEREAFLAEAPHHRMLLRREIENYLFDAEVIEAYAAAKGRPFDRSTYEILVPDVSHGDLKPVQQRIAQLAGFTGRVADFKETLADFIDEGMAVYAEMEACVL